MRLVLLVLAIIITSCSADWHLKRAIIKSSPNDVFDKLNSKYGGFIERKDTVFYDTTFVFVNAFDTMKVTRYVDTIVINRNNEILSVIRHYDTIYVKSSGIVDTVIKTIEVPKYTIIHGNDDKNLWFNILFFLSIIFIITTLLSYYARK